MLNSLEIKNFRNLKGLRLNSLARVNLVIGKNNTGKSTLLEAIAVYAAKGDLSLIFTLLEERGEFDLNDKLKVNQADIDKGLSCLFTGRTMSFDKKNAIVISAAYSANKRETISEELFTLRFLQYADEIKQDGDSTSHIRRYDVGNIESAQSGFEIKFGKTAYLLPLDKKRPFNFNFKMREESEAFQLIGTRGIDREENGKLWDAIVLTDKEQIVVDALKIIEPNVVGLAFVGENSSERKAVIRLKNEPKALPLRSMGDGVNRILTIILGLVNAENGYLLIDEFENGLHYATQESLWKIIFHLAEKLNVQVFATTHSNDCIAGFEQILNEKGIAADGKLIRLDAEDGVIKAVEFSPRELEIAMKRNIETRR